MISFMKKLTAETVKNSSDTQKKTLFYKMIILQIHTFRIAKMMQEEHCDEKESIKHGAVQSSVIYFFEDNTEHELSVLEISNKISVPLPNFIPPKIVGYSNGKMT